MTDFALPLYGFRYLTVYELDRLNIMDIQPDAHKGYIFTVDLEIPVEMHVRHQKTQSLVRLTSLNIQANW
jgi:hypothetical protein